MYMGTSIKRWAKKRQLQLCICATLSFVFLTINSLVSRSNDIPIVEQHFRPFSEKCISTAAKRLIKEQCSNYSLNLSFGSLCQPLCESKIVVEDCIHHGQTYVLFAKFNGRDIVLKKKKPHHYSTMKRDFHDYALHVKNLSKIHSQFEQLITSEVEASMGSHFTKVFHSSVNKFTQYGLGEDLSMLTLQQMLSFWPLLRQDEFVMLALNQENPSFPELIGSCGMMYAVESTTPYNAYFPEAIPRMTWNERVKITSGFLQLLYDFERGKNGRLSHCDVQEGNFGLTKDWKVKAIDVDLIMPEMKIGEMLEQGLCKKDAECDFFDCNSACNVTTGKCSNVQTTNNFHIMCRDIFFPVWPITGLLSYKVPSVIKAKLTELLTDCRSPTFGRYSMQSLVVTGTYAELVRLLKISLQ